ncbi:hypothetical protein HK096_003925, partial [Nowakowskiella sp. JEL0078]
MSESVFTVLVLKKENEDLYFELVSARPSTFDMFLEKVLLKIREDLPPGCTPTLKYKNNVSKQYFEMRDNEDVERVLSMPSSFEILVFPKKPHENIVVAKQSIYDIFKT